VSKKTERTGDKRRKEEVEESRSQPHVSRWGSSRKLGADLN
jgi:hypothetical protein